MVDCVAIYGTLRKGGYNHKLLETAEHLGDCRVAGWGMKSLGGFPSVYQGEGSVLVEVYRLNNTAQLQSLDYLEGYRGEDMRNFYERTTVPTPFGEAYLYYQKAKEVESYISIPTGDWADKNKPKGV